MYEELSENSSTMNEQLSLLQEENQSLKSKINLTEQRYESQISQIMRLNEEISKSMQEKEQLESDVSFFKNLYDSMSTSSLPPAVAEEMRKKVETVGIEGASERLADAGMLEAAVGKRRAEKEARRERRVGARKHRESR